MSFLNLDKTFTIRQILWRILFVFLSLALLYFCLSVRRDWNVAMGGVGIGNTPYRQIIPKSCLSFSDTHRGKDYYGSLARTGLTAFQVRTHVVNIKKYEQHVDCSGYGILTGLHGDFLASYRYIYITENGEPLAIETVEYHTKRHPNN
jgi:hypothetical protein